MVRRAQNIFSLVHEALTTISTQFSKQARDWFGTYIEAIRANPHFREWAIVLVAPGRNMDWGVEIFSGSRHGNSQADYVLKADTRTIELNNPNALYDPHTPALLSALLRFPYFREYVVTDHKSFHTPLASALQGVQRVAGHYSTYPARGGQRSEKPFGMLVFRQLFQRDWYHVTTKEAVPSIMRTGLRPSSALESFKGFVSLDALSRTGMSTVNLDMQAAVYLVGSLQKARKIGEIVIAKRRQSAVILQVNSNILKEYHKLVVDEDILRDYTGRIDPVFSGTIPHFLDSALNINTIGYRGIIPPSMLRIVEEMTHDTYWDEEDEYEN